MTPKRVVLATVAVGITVPLDRRCFKMMTIVKIGGAGLPTHEAVSLCPGIIYPFANCGSRGPFTSGAHYAASRLHYRTS